MSPLHLEITEGRGSGRQFDLEASTEIGRSAEAGIVIDDPLVSRRHARLAPAPVGGWLVEDLYSSNGTLLNGHPLYAPAPVAEGDTLTLGTTVLRVRSDRQVAARESLVRPVPAALQPRPAPPAPAPTPPTAARRQIEALLDSRVRHQARTAPLAIFAVVVLVVLIYLARR